jgi:hypothetical protein
MSAVQHVKSAVESGDEAEFTALMRRGADYVADVQAR